MPFCGQSGFYVFDGEKGFFSPFFEDKIVLLSGKTVFSVLRPMNSGLFFKKIRRILSRLIVKPNFGC